MEPEMQFIYDAHREGKAAEITKFAKMISTEVHKASGHDVDFTFDGITLRAYDHAHLIEDLLDLLKSYAEDMS